MKSFEPIDQKPSLHVNIDKLRRPGAAFFGLKDLTLNNMHSDFSMMHERIAYWVARQAGVPASRANHALVHRQRRSSTACTPTSRRCKKHMLTPLFGDDTGSLFSATDVDFVAPFIPTLRAGRRARRSHAALGPRVGADRRRSGDDAMAAAAGFADVDEFMRFWALCAVVGQFDSFPYSSPGDDYFAYANPATGRLAFMPWGIDESFYAGDIDVSKIHSVFAVQCQESPSCYRKFVDNVWDILALTDRLDWLAEHDRVAAQIAPFVAMDSRKWYTNDQVAMYQMDMWYFMCRPSREHRRLDPAASGAPATGMMPQR